MSDSHHADGLRRDPPDPRAYGLAVRRTGTPGDLRVALAGELDLATAAIAERELRDAEQAARVLELDLRNLTFIDAAGLAIVIAAQQRALEACRRFVVRITPGCVQRLFDLTGTDRRVEVVVDPPPSAFFTRNGSGPA